MCVTPPHERKSQATCSRFVMQSQITNPEGKPIFFFLLSIRRRILNVSFFRQADADKCDGFKHHRTNI